MGRTLARDVPDAIPSTARPRQGLFFHGRPGEACRWFGAPPERSRLFQRRERRLEHAGLHAPAIAATPPDDDVRLLPRRVSLVRDAYRVPAGADAIRHEGPRRAGRLVR